MEATVLTDEKVVEKTIDVPQKGTIQRFEPDQVVGKRQATLAKKSLSWRALGPKACEFDVIVSTGAPVYNERYDWAAGEYKGFFRHLEVSEKGIDCCRFEAGAPFLDMHNTYDSVIDSQLGKVVKTWIEYGDKPILCATIRMMRVNDRQKSIAEGIRMRLLSGISVGFSILEQETMSVDERGIEHVMATRWQPREVSIVTIPADVECHVRSAKPISHEAKMTKKVQLTPAEKRFSVTEDLVSEVLADAQVPSEVSDVDTDLKASTEQLLVEAIQAVVDKVAADRAPSSEPMSDPVGDPGGEPAAALSAGDAPHNRAATAAQVTALAKELDLPPELSLAFLERGFSLDKCRISASVFLKKKLEKEVEKKHQKDEKTEARVDISTVRVDEKSESKNLITKNRMKREALLSWIYNRHIMDIPKNLKEGMLEDNPYMGWNMQDFARDCVRETDSSYTDKQITKMKPAEIFDALDQGKKRTKIKVSKTEHFRSYQEPNGKFAYMKIAERSGGGGVSAMHLSDFPGLLMNTINLGIYAEWEQAKKEQSFEPLIRRVTKENFEDEYAVTIGGIGKLKRILESGEAVYGGLIEEKEKYNIKKYGRGYAMSRELFLADKTKVIAGLISSGYELSELESDLVWDEIISGTVGDPAAPWASTGNKNLSTGADLALGASADPWKGVNQIALKFGSQTGVGDTGDLNLTLKYLLCPPVLYYEAKRLARMSASTGVSDPKYINVHDFEPIKEGRLARATNGNATYYGISENFAPGQLPLVVFVNLAGSDIPYVNFWQENRNDDYHWKLIYDVGAKFLNYRLGQKVVGS